MSRLPARTYVGIHAFLNLAGQQILKACTAIDINLPDIEKCPTETNLKFYALELVKGLACKLMLARFNLYEIVLYFSIKRYFFLQMNFKKPEIKKSSNRYLH